uniref:Uncharacterized protein n=1 Tax=Peronospora matthiolae TaxID=2874970 RepID=A0AAV1V5K4_9STRA
MLGDDQSDHLEQHLALMFVDWRLDVGDAKVAVVIFSRAAIQCSVQSSSVHGINTVTVEHGLGE